jgi:hypothetical protein
MRYSEVHFVHNVHLPDGGMGSAIRAHAKHVNSGDKFVTINREGDTVTVTWCLPGNEYSANPVEGTRDYNWSIVGWSTREVVPPTKGGR